MDNQVHLRRLQQWSKLVLEAENAGNKVEWCKTNKIPYRQYMYWQKLVRDHILVYGEKSVNADGPRQPDSGSEPHELVDITSAVHCKPDVVEKAVSPVAIPAASSESASSAVHPELMLEYKDFHIYIGSRVSRETLSAVLKVIKNA